MIGIGPLGAFLIGIFAVASATPVLALAAIERPIQAQVPRAAIWLAGTWCVVFVAAATVVAFRTAELGITGLLVAGAELSGAAAIWLGRSRPGGGGGGGGGDGGGNDRLDDPRGPLIGGLPEEYWRRWEADLNAPSHITGPALR